MVQQAYTHPTKISNSENISKCPAIIKDSSDNYCIVWQDNRKFGSYNIYAKKVDYSNTMQDFDQQQLTNHHYNCVNPDAGVDGSGKFHVVYTAKVGDEAWTHKYDCDVIPADDGWLVIGVPPYVQELSDGILKIIPTIVGSGYAFQKSWGASHLTGYCFEVKFRLLNSADENTFIAFNTMDGANKIQARCRKDSVEIMTYNNGVPSEYEYEYIPLDCTEWNVIRFAQYPFPSTEVEIIINDMLMFNINVDYGVGNNLIEIYVNLVGSLAEIAELDYVYYYTGGIDPPGSKYTSELRHIILDNDGTNIIETVLASTALTEYKNPIIKVGSDDCLYVVWQQGIAGSGNDDIYFQKFNNDGSASGDTPLPVQISNSVIAGGTSRCPYIVLDSSENSYVVWDDNRIASIEQIYVAQLDSLGTITFAEIALTVTDYNESPRLAVNSNDVFYIIWDKYKEGYWGVYFADLSAFSENSVSPESEDAFWPDMIIDSDNNIHAVWSEYDIRGDYYISFKAWDLNINFITHKTRLCWEQGANLFPRICYKNDILNPKYTKIVYQASPYYNETEIYDVHALASGQVYVFFKEKSGSIVTIPTLINTGSYKNILTY